METINRALLTFLLNALWMAPVAWAVAALACRLMPNGPARHRHAVWVAALAAAIILPATSIRAPQRASFQPATPSLAGTAPIVAPELRTTPGSTPSAPVVRAIAFPHDWAAILLGVYAAFLAFRLMQLVRALWRTYVVRRDAAAGDPTPVLARCAHAFGTRDIALLRSEDITGPVALHRSIILPDGMFAESRDEVLATAIGHEMAHIARRDFALKLLYEIVYLPLSFHPAAILIRRGIEQSREMACDELVTGRLLAPEVYARSILAIAGAALPQTEYALGVFDGDILEERIRRIVARRALDLRRARLVLAGAVSAFLVCLVLAGGFCVAGYAQTAVQAEMQAAADAYNRAEYGSAVEHFENAVKLDPSNLKARLFLANAYVQQAKAEKQFLPLTPDKPLLNAALDQYREVLGLDPNNATAMFGIVSLSSMANPRESRDLMLKLISIDPGNADAYTNLAVLDWSAAYHEIQARIKESGLSPAIHQIPDATTRANLRGRVSPAIDEGLRMLQMALERKPDSETAMAYANLLHRSKGIIAETAEESQSELAEADAWVGKALAQMKANASKPKPGPLDINGAALVTAPLPPPPPPPPPPGVSPLRREGGNR